MIGNFITVPEAVVAERRRLTVATKQMVKRGHAEGTRSNHRCHINSYERFCNELWFQPYLATEWQLCMYGQYPHEQSKKPGTVNNYVSSVRTMHKMASLTVPDTNNIHFKLLVGGLKRQRKELIRQAHPIDHQKLLKLFQQVDVAEQLQAVSWTAVLVGFNLVLRVSNLGPPSRTKFNPEKHFIRQDLQVMQGHLALGIRWSKTNQFKNRTQWAPLLAQPNKWVCPEFWLKCMIKIIPGKPTDPLFFVVEDGQKLPVSAAQINRLLKKWCKAADLDLQKFTAHCLSRRGLTWEHDAKIIGEFLMAMGDWRSTVYRDYVHIDYNRRLQSVKQMVSTIKC